MSSFRSIWAGIIWLGAAGVCATALGLASAFLYLDPQIPTTEAYSQYRFETPLRIFTRDDKLIGEFGDRRTIPIAFEDTPRTYIDALLNTEDKRFFDHAGVDLVSLANDIIAVATSDVLTGASTITMQLAKIISFSPEQTFIRKFKEMLLALKIEHALTKEEILELYINIAPLGKHAYGVQAGAHTYYGKPVSELTLAQTAMLAAISKRPEAGNPINGPDYALRRRNLVLRRMLEQDSITRQEYDEAVAAPITALVHRRELDLVAPYPSEWVRQQLFERYGNDIYAGYEAVTTIDSRLQAAAQQALRGGLEAYDRRHGYRGGEGRIEVPAEFAPAGWGAPAAQSAGAGTDGTAVAAIAEQSPPSFEDTPEFADFMAGALAEHRAVHGMEPAVVLAAAERRLLVGRRDASTAVLPWDGLRWARPYINENAVGARPATATDVARPGEIVRIANEDGVWRLTQVPEIEGALVALDPADGSVRALVGGYDFVGNQFNHALQARRQPGSGFKPFVYSAALESGITPASIFLDAPLVFDDENLEMAYRPRNDSGRYNGPTRLREALYRSINLVSMRVMLQVGAPGIIEHAAGFGFPTARFPRDTQLAIGGGTMAVTPVEMATAYAALANGGFAVPPAIIERVRLTDGATVLEPERPAACDPCIAAVDDDETPPRAAPRAVSPQNAFIIDSMLKDVIRRGTGRRALVLERPDLAGKTGTTNEAADTWFNGYHPHLAATAWVGFSEVQPIGAREYGSTTPLGIWVDFMREALADEPVIERAAPAGVVSVRVNAASGNAASPDDRNAIFEYFLADNAPRPRPRTRLDRDESPRVVRPEDIF